MNGRREGLEATKQGLIAMRQLLDKEENWCRGQFALDKNAHPTDPWDPEACQWCVMGAAIKVFGPNELPGNLTIEYCDIGPEGDKISLNGLVDNIVGYANVIEWQDRETTTHADILHMLDEAILRYKFWYSADAPDPQATG